MVKRKRVIKRPSDVDGLFLLKLLLYVLIGSMWLKFVSGGSVTFGLPIGFIAGLFFVRYERFRIDRKMEYVALLVAMLVGYFAPYGFYLSF
jgi:ABC-type phosphate transport system permease subunit